MNAFGEKLKEIRMRDDLTLEQAGERFNVLPGTYDNVERGMSSPQSPTARKILVSDALDAEDKEALTKLAKIKPQNVVINVTDDDRAEYRRRKNAKYFKEREKLKRTRKDKVIRAVSKSAAQRIFY